jgi:hypothetical protein
MGHAHSRLRAPRRPFPPGIIPNSADPVGRAGATQTFELIWYGAGYHNNVVQRIPIRAA